jgi:hypothetical protein
MRAKSVQRGNHLIFNGMYVLEQVAHIWEYNCSKTVQITRTVIYFENLWIYYDDQLYETYEWKMKILYEKVILIWQPPLFSLFLCQTLFVNPLFGISYYWLHYYCYWGKEIEISIKPLNSLMKNPLRKYVVDRLSEFFKTLRQTLTQSNIF